MPPPQSDNDSEAPDWWKERPAKEVKAAQQRAVKDYLIAENTTATKLKFNKRLVINMLPYVAKYNKQWKGFDPP